MSSITNKIYGNALKQLTLFIITAPVARRILFLKNIVQYNVSKENWLKKDQDNDLSRDG